MQHWNLYRLEDNAINFSAISGLSQYLQDLSTNTQDYILDVGQDTDNLFSVEGEQTYDGIKDAIWQKRGGSQRLETEQGRRLEDYLQPATELDG